MDFPGPLFPARFVSREKRFLIHAVLPDGTRTIAHTNNTGRMSGCLFPGGRIWLSAADNPRRKLKWTLEIVETTADPDRGIEGGILVGVNTAKANHLVTEALTAGILDPLAGYTDMRTEVPYGRRGSRADILLEYESGEEPRRCWVEVKNVSLVSRGHARFPDAPSLRARKHLQDLADAVAAGDRAALVFCCQRGDPRTVGPADDIDPEYGQLLRQVIAAGVEAYGAACSVTTSSVTIHSLIPVFL